MQTVRDPSALAHAWELEYARLARAVASVLPPETSTLVEVGCGDGQLTIPLARLVPSVQMDVIDRFAGPYASNRASLLERLKSARLTDRVRVLSGDATNTLRQLPSGSLDAVVSSEFLCELSTPSLLPFLKSCRRVLKAGGLTVHSFLSPVPRNEGQALTIEADSDPRWTTHPPTKWFSPPPEVARKFLIEAGFVGAGVEVKRSRLRFLGVAAQAQLKDWRVRETFYRDQETVLRARGLELPDWIVVSGTRRR